MGTREDGMNQEKRLESWKEIEAYLKRDFRTLRRWEKEEGLPVHRHSHKSRSSVYAYPSEIDAWRVSRKVAPELPPARPLWKFPAFAATMLLCLIMVGNGVRPVSAQTKQAARQVLAGGGRFDLQGSVSGDGQFLSYVNATGDLAIRNLETGDTRRLTDNPDASWTNSAGRSIMSPDGGQVAYEWYLESQGFWDLRIIPASGGKTAPRVIYRNHDVSRPQPLGWLPDGSGILADLWRQDLTHQLAMISIDGRGATTLKSFDWRSANKLSLSPDGRYVAYDFPPSEDDPEHDIYILSVDGSRETRAVQSPANDVVVGWAPDGKSLLFSSDRTGSPGLWSIGVADGKPVGQPSLLKKDIGRIASLGLSSKGTLYYGVQAGIRDVHTVSIDPKTLKPVSEPVLPAQRFLGINSGADWSHDGRSLMYASRGSVLTFHSLADGTERDLMPKLASINGGGLGWSPDGRSVLVTGVDRKAQQGLYRVDTQSGATVPVASGQRIWAVWSRDGTIYYELSAIPPSNNARIMSLDTRNNAEREVYRPSTHNAWPLTISPDGKNLAFFEGRDDHSKGDHILVLPLDGGKPRVLAEFTPMRMYVGLEWTPDGESVLFAKAGPNDQSVDLWRVNVRTGAQSPVGSYPGEGLGAIRISPDGRQMSYMYGGTTSEIWALENFLPKAGPR
jgi:Tol biopolymer transport system component